MAAPDRLIRAIAFDLDGTLARTATLRTDRRRPIDVLARARPLSGPKGLSFGPEVSRQPARFIARGVPVAVVTRAPAAYAATLLGLLEIDYCRLFASDAGSGTGAEAVARRLQRVAEAFSVTGTHLLYVGDTPEDEAAARIAGCRYTVAPWLASAAHHAALLNSPGIVDQSRTAAPVDTALIDSAVDRLVDGEATDTDYRLLEMLDFRFWLRQHGDPDRVMSDAIRDDMTARRSPWRLCTSDDWEAVVASGDIGQLTEMAGGSVGARLPDPRLLAKLRRIQTLGGGDTIASIVEQLGWSAQHALGDDWGRWTPVSGPLTVTERRALADAIGTRRPIDESLAHRVANASELTDAGRASLAHALLTSFCAGPSRRQLQLLVLRGADPDQRRCFIDIDAHEGRFGLPAAVLTQAECQEDDDLLAEYQQCLRRLFPLRRLSRQSSGTTVFACVRFHSDWGYALSHAKNWHSGSGPEVRTSMLTFPGSVLAAHLRVGEAGAFGVVPAPVSGFSVAKPGEAALRLALRAAAESRCQLYPVLTKTEDGFVATSSGGGASVLLVEDQVTSGRTIRGSVAALSQAAWNVRGAVAWSASDASLAAETGVLDSAAMLSSSCPHASNLLSVIGTGHCAVHPVA